MCLICHNIHMLHFASIWCVRCSQSWTPNKALEKAKKEEKRENIVNISPTSVPFTYPSHRWPFCSEQTKFNESFVFYFQLSSHKFPTGTIMITFMKMAG